MNLLKSLFFAFFGWHPASGAREADFLDGRSVAPICTPDACHAHTPDPDERPLCFHFGKELEKRRAEGRLNL